MRFEIRPSQSSSQPYYWRTVADNGQVLSTSETYTSKAGCQNAIDVLKREAASARVDDLT